MLFPPSAIQSHVHMLRHQSPTAGLLESYLWGCNEEYKDFLKQYSGVKEETREHFEF